MGVETDIVPESGSYGFVPFSLERNIFTIIEGRKNNVNPETDSWVYLIDLVYIYANHSRISYIFMYIVHIKFETYTGI